MSTSRPCGYSSASRGPCSRGISQSSVAQTTSTGRSTDYADACPIGTVALEVANNNEVLRVATAEVFEEWVGTATRWFGRWVAEPETAQSLAYSMVMMLEGAFMLSRAARDPEPLRVAGRSMAALLHTAITRADQD
ncbi:TetR family transcriptional regulator C-terminal domain-containing protein [Streptomyces sp. NPDC017082]|uniref:LmrA/YxaF family transcription factor n=1 Tax=Streptomyces sp. NPDC017082 TaxID=3364974 RepID=UPI00378E6960